MKYLYPGHRAAEALASGLLKQQSKYSASYEKELCKTKHEFSSFGESRRTLEFQNFIGSQHVRPRYANQEYYFTHHVMN